MGSSTFTFSQISWITWIFYGINVTSFRFISGWLYSWHFFIFLISCWFFNLSSPLRLSQSAHYDWPLSLSLIAPNPGAPPYESFFSQMKVWVVSLVYVLLQVVSSWEQIQTQSRSLLKIDHLKLLSKAQNVRECVRERRRVCGFKKTRYKLKTGSKWKSTTPTNVRKTPQVACWFLLWTEASPAADFDKNTMLKKLCARKNNKKNVKKR